MSVRRNIKNVVYNYSESARKAREATSNDPWGPSTTLMQEIADLTYNMVAYADIMPIVWKRLNDHGKNWRHVYKSLVLLDYLVRYGSKRITQQCKENIFVIQTLKDFQYIEGNRDQGLNVREKAKQLVALLKDDERLKNERAKAEALRQRMNQGYPLTGGSELERISRSSRSSQRTENYFPTSFPPYGISAASQRNLDPNIAKDYAAPVNAEEESIQVQLALAISKEEAQAEENRRHADHTKLSLAVNESLSINQQNAGKHASENDLLGIFEGWTDNTVAVVDDGHVLVNRPVSANPWISQPCGNSRLYNDDVWGSPSTPWTPLSTSYPNDDIWSSKPKENDIAPSSEGDPTKIVDVANELNKYLTQSSIEFPATNSTEIAEPLYSYEKISEQYPSNKAYVKGPESFLGEHHSLVDLNNLADNQKQYMWNEDNYSDGISSQSIYQNNQQSNVHNYNPSFTSDKSTANPFALSSMTSAKQTSNPFIQAATKAPTLNELSNKSGSDVDDIQNRGVLPPPLISSNNVAITSSAQSQQANDFNPFI